MAYLWAFLAMSLLVAVVVLIVALSKRRREAAHFASQWQASAAYGQQVGPRAAALEESLQRANAQIIQSQGEAANFEARWRESDAYGRQVGSRVTDLEDRLQTASDQLNRCLRKYAHVIDVDAEADRIKHDVHDLDTKRRELHKDVTAKSRELNDIEESLSSADVGLYKPHYDWNDAAKYRLALDAHYKKHTQFIKANKATLSARNWVVGGSEKEGERLTKDLSKLILRAFNAECEAAIGKVRWNNFDVMKKRIEKAYETINKLVSRWQLSVTHEYLMLWLEELVLTHEHQEQQEKEREEQRRINERIREDEKAQRELDRAQREAEDAEQRTQEALDRARRELESARAEDAGRFNQRIAQLEAALAEAHAKSERAKSQAELTRAGHVYIISNVGSFGEDIFKIGMTRRLEPIDRIRELGDASVPFFFDVHGMIHSDDAPALETQLHSMFASRRVNLVNYRKEFFNISMNEIVSACKELGLEVELTLLAEAKEYRQTKVLRMENISAASRRAVRVEAQ